MVVALLIAAGWRAPVARAGDAPAKGESATPAAPAPAPDRAGANTRDLYAHLQITFTGKEAFRENLLLQGAMFYDAVDRPDLAARYRELEARKNLVGMFGGLALGGGAVWGAIDLTIAKTDPHAHHSATVIPWAIASAGLVALVVAVVLPGEPMSEPEREALARAHNQRVAARLGAGPDDGTPASK